MKDRDTARLEAMLTEAEGLCLGADALMSGQYAFLRDRIAALIELRRAAAFGRPAPTA